jgi:hypothetical protein
MLHASKLFLYNVPKKKKKKHYKKNLSFDCHRSSFGLGLVLDSVRMINQFVQLWKTDIPGVQSPKKTPFSYEDCPVWQE